MPTVVPGAMSAAAASASITRDRSEALAMREVVNSRSPLVRARHSCSGGSRDDDAAYTVQVAERGNKVCRLPGDRPDSRRRGTALPPLAKYSQINCERVSGVRHAVRTGRLSAGPQFKPASAERTRP